MPFFQDLSKHRALVWGPAVDQLLGIFSGRVLVEELLEAVLVMCATWVHCLSPCVVCLYACITCVAPWTIPHVGHTKDRWARRHCATLHQHVLYYHVSLHCVLTY